MPRKNEKKQIANQFDIKGGVHAGRDVIMGNQYNDLSQTSQTLNISTPAQFIAELQSLRVEIAALKSLPGVESSAVRRLDVVEGDIEEVITEAGREKPAIEKIKSTLDEAKETMDKLGGSITSAVNLGVLIGNLALMAAKVFGG